ncbi:MAG: hypothetical protein GY912_04550, partial [Candidatus Marinimicrobia bacterium]|nr:hypothetical protein [Candidatus Neomarinimicrobiota bacterium]
PRTKANAQNSLHTDNEKLDQPADATAPPPDTPLNVVLMDDEGQPQLDKNGKPITIRGQKPEDLKGITFLKTQPDGTTLRARIVDLIKGNKDLIKFKLKYDTTDVEDIIAYNDVMNYIHRDTTKENGELWKFRRILGHQGPLTRDHVDYKGSKYNVSIEWENGEITYKPLKNI